MVSKKTKEWAPLSRSSTSIASWTTRGEIADAGRGPRADQDPGRRSACCATTRRRSAPTRLPAARSAQEVRQAERRPARRQARRARTTTIARSDEWLLLFVAGMWFQDLWTYDFRRTEMCIIPYATQMGEISFCAYNTGVGWRQIVEKMYQNATVAEWYQRARQARGLREPAQGRAAARRGPAGLAPDPARRPSDRMESPSSAATAQTPVGALAD